MSGLLSEFNQVINLDRLMQFARELVVPIADAVGSLGTALNALSLEVEGIDGRVDSLEVPYYGVCGTASSTAAKTVTTQNSGYNLSVGEPIIVKFTNADTSTNPTLNVDDSGAKAIYKDGAAVASGVLEAGHYYILVYNGTAYELVSGVGADGISAYNVSFDDSEAGLGVNNAQDAFEAISAMLADNHFYASITDDSDFVIVDDDGNEIVGDWKYNML